MTCFITLDRSFLMNLIDGNNMYNDCTGTIGRMLSNFLFIMEGNYLLVKPSQFW